jgi:hypothetical protein
MRKIAILLLLMAIAAPVVRSRIQADGLDIGYFGGGDFKLSRVNNVSAPYVGLQGGLILQHCLVVGLTANDLLGWVPDTSADSVRMWYGGLDLEFIVPPRENLSLTLGSTFGIGQFRMLGSNQAPDNLAVIEPAVGFIYPLSPAVQIAATGGYRLVFLANFMTNGYASGPVGSVVVRFGKF